MSRQLDLIQIEPALARPSGKSRLARELARGSGPESGPAERSETSCHYPDGRHVSVPTFVNEFWTSKQRAANALHEISYRACFKPQLPRFFIDRLTRAGDRVYDPFMGRGTALLEAALLERIPCGCDANPLSEVLIAPRLSPPRLEDVASRLAGLDWNHPGEEPQDLLVFYHPDTLRSLSSLRRYLLETRAGTGWDEVDGWIAMVALNRLTGHSAGFFSVYTMPPNQAVSVASQRKINAKRGQVPPARDVAGLLLKKSKQLLKHCDEPTRSTLRRTAGSAQLLTGLAHDTPQIAPCSIDLVVTSPPFLDVVNYAQDNWLRCWFLGMDAQSIPLTTPNRLDVWQAEMTKVFRELHRVLRPGGHVAFEVGELEGGTVRLEESVLPCGAAAGLAPELVMINRQSFTKTANCWGVRNNEKGTNSNRVVIFQKPQETLPTSTQDERLKGR